MSSDVHGSYGYQWHHLDTCGALKISLMSSDTGEKHRHNRYHAIPAERHDVWGEAMSPCLLGGGMDATKPQASKVLAEPTRQRCRQLFPLSRRSQRHGQVPDVLDVSQRLFGV